MNKNTMLDELMAMKRSEMLAACRAEISQPEGVHRLAECVSKVFDDLACLLKPDADDAGEPPCSTTAAGFEASLVGTSAAMSRVRIAINRLSHRSRAPVLILGDAGTGRRRCARALHFETYPDGEFLELEDLDQLNGLERRLATLRARSGSEFTGGLTVYIRNLLDCPLKLQDKVAHLTRERGLSLRVVTSSHQPLSAPGVQQGRLGADLLRAFPNELKLPPLIEREADVCELARHLAQAASKKTGQPPVRFSEAAFTRLQTHSWPENVIELAALVDRLSREHAGELIDDVDLSELDTRPSGIVFRLPPSGLDLAALERELLAQALAMAGNNQTRAASLLGLTRDQIRYRLAKFEIATLAVRTG
ncbi:MAG: helix-turn-helix domain-containing protein [Pseudomonadota bacterium]